MKTHRLTRNASGLLFCSVACRYADGRTSGWHRPSRMVDLRCPVCGANFQRKPAERRNVNYCSVSCSAKANMTLKPTPKGERRAPATEFKPGTRPHNHTAVGTVKIRTRHKRHGDRRAWVKIAEPNVWELRAILNYEAANGPRLRGKVIHHVDHDSLNDAADNLVALTRAEHAAIHAGTPSNMPN